MRGLIEMQPEPLGIMPPAAEAVVRETHHRVSNHLQILASLIGLQAHDVGEAVVREALLDVRRRVLAVARIHRELQAGDQDGEVEISSYLARLQEDLRLCYGLESGAALDLQFHVEPALVAVDAALTVGLVVNELVTNAVKHAVLVVGGGVQVSLARQLDGMWVLMVCDAGPGAPASVLEASREGGFSLVQALVRKLKGRISLQQLADGSAVLVTYP